MFICRMITLLLLAGIASSCVTTPMSVNTEYWQNLVTSEQFKSEKRLYYERMGEKNFCWETGVSDFLTNTNIKPTKECLYPSSQMFIKDDDGMILINKVAGQRLKQLKVMQITSDGFLVVSPNNYQDQLIYIYKTDETNIVDGSYLDEINWTIYEYAGTYTYKTLLNSKTVHSFRRISKKRIENANKELQIFSPIIEFWVYNQLWYYLEDKPTPYRNN